MRKWPTPRALFIAGLTLLVLAIAGAVVFRQPPEPGGTTPPIPTSPAPTVPSTPAFSISTAGTPPPGSFATTIIWQTPTPSTGRISWGPAGMQPLLWTSSPQRSILHHDVLTGLASSTPYVVSIEARSATGDVASTRLEITTAAAPLAPVGTVQDGAVRVDGVPFFPLITWQECPSQWAPDIAYGINLFAGNPCTGLSSLLTAVQGQALAAGTADDTADTSGPGLLGWFYADEADARGLTADTLGTPGAGLRFLTITAHFFPRAAPLPGGRAMYPGLVAKSDVIGFDLYPLQELCRPELLPWVFDAQQHLAQLAGSKPTFQWIEVRQLKCPDAADAVSARTIRIESWLAIAGGARGLGFFPGDWGTEVGAAIHGIALRIRQLEPALLNPAVGVDVEPAQSAVRASAHEFGGALYVIAVNAGPQATQVRLGVPGLAGRSLLRIGTQQMLASRGRYFDAVLPPMSVRMYVARPSD